MACARMRMLDLMCYITHQWHDIPVSASSGSPPPCSTFFSIFTGSYLQTYLVCIPFGVPSLTFLILVFNSNEARPVIGTHCTSFYALFFIYTLMTGWYLAKLQISILIQCLSPPVATRINFTVMYIGCPQTEKLGVGFKAKFESGCNTSRIISVSSKFKQEADRHKCACARTHPLNRTESYDLYKLHSQSNHHWIFMVVCLCISSVVRHLYTFKLPTKILYCIVLIICRRISPI